MKTIVSLIVLLCVSMAHAEPTPGELLGKAIAGYEKMQVIKRENTAALGGKDRQLNKLSTLQRAWAGKPASQQRVDYLQKRLKQYEDEVTNRTGQKGMDQWVEQNKSKAAYYRKLINASTEPDEAARKQNAGRLKEQCDALSAEIVKISKPFEARRKALLDAFEPHAKELEAVLTKHLKSPTGKFASASADLSARPLDGVISCSWVDGRGKQVAWSHMRIRDAKEISDSDRRNLLDEKYPIRTQGSRHLWVWAGNVLVTFVPSHKDLQNKDALKAQIGNFIDLAGLAAIDAKPAE